MSKTETSNAPTTKTITKNVKIFDLKTFAEVSKEVKVDFTPATTAKEAVERLGGDEATILKALNSALQDAAVSDARRQVLTEGASKKVVLDFIKPFRMAAPYAQLVTKEKGQDGWKAEYNNQTREILKQVATSEFMLNAIRSAAANATDESEEEDSE